MPPRPLSESGGSGPAHTEIVLSGPFKGQDKDVASWFTGGSGTLDEAINVDFRKGQFTDRPGWATVYSMNSMLGQTPTSTTGTTSAYETSTVPKTMSVAGLGAPVLLLADYNLYSSYVSGLSTPLPVSWPQDGSLVNFKAFAPSIQYSYANFRTNGTGAIVSAFAPNAGYDLWKSRYCVGCYLNVDPATESYQKVTSQTATQLLFAYGAFTAVNTSFATATLSLPVATNWVVSNASVSRYTNVVIPVPPADRYYVCGPYGGAVLSYDPTSTPADAFWQEDATTNTTQYRAKNGAFYSNRVIIATDESATYSTSAVAWTANSHPGRFAYSGNGDFYDFAATSAGSFDGSLGSVFSMFTMRDVLYAVCERGILSIQKTGNSRLPFRQQAIVESPMFLDAQSVVIDSSYALIPSMTGLVKFDGSSISFVQPGMTEFFRGDYPYRISYDTSRRRAMIALSSLTKAVAMDVDTGGWVQMQLAASDDIYEFAPWYYASGGEIDQEYVMLAEQGFGVAKRSARLDANQTSGTTKACSVTTPILDTSSSRMRKTCDRIRIAYECTGSQDLSLTWTLYTDGGVTAAKTGTVTLTANASAGVVTQAYATFTPVTGQQFNVKLSWTNSSSSAPKPFFNEVALSFINRQEARPS